MQTASERTKQNEEMPLAANMDRPGDDCTK